MPNWTARDWFRELTEEPVGDELAAWSAWFLAHGIAPEDVAYATDNPSWSCWVERRDSTTQHQIVYTALAVDDTGQQIMAERIVDLPDSPTRFPVP